MDRFKTSRNFLATDKVPDSIFGIPVVSREEDYTEADLAFFRDHPEAGGYYDMEGEQEEQQGAMGGGIAFASIFGPEGLKNLMKAGWKNPPKLSSASTGADGSGVSFSVGELKDVTMRGGWERALLRKEKILGDILDFSSPQGKRLLVAYPGLDRIKVTNEKRTGVDDAGRHGGSGDGEYIWVNPDHESYRNRNVKDIYDTVLHEGINHAIFQREPSFPNRTRPYGDLTDFGYAIDLEESIVDLASKRGAERWASGKGSADPEGFAKSINQHRIKRGQEALLNGAEPVIYMATAAEDNGVPEKGEEVPPSEKGAK